MKNSIKVIVASNNKEEFSGCSYLQSDKTARQLYAQSPVRQEFTAQHPTTRSDASKLPLN
jgi:hypothetical protein